MFLSRNPSANFGAADIEAASADKHPQDTTDDLLLAQMLQAEFDRENDSYVKIQEKHVNGTSKGKEEH